MQPIVFTSILRSITQWQSNFYSVFSRKIGFAFDTITGTNVQTPIQYGARLSGKLDDNWRMD